MPNCSRYDTAPTDEDRMSRRIRKDLLAILVCPKCRKPVERQGDELQCSNPRCGLCYPVRDGVPIMLIDEARDPAGPRPGSL